MSSAKLCEGNSGRLSINIAWLNLSTVEPPITDPSKGRQLPYSRQGLWHGLK